MRSGLGSVFPTAVLLVAWRGDVVFHRAYGWLDPESHRRPAQPDSMFDLASLTKIFTATAFMTLVQAGAVTLDTAVGEVLSEFSGVRPISSYFDAHTKKPVPPDPAFAGRLVDADKITFRHLLTHTSGLPPWWNLCANVDSANLPAALPADRLGNFFKTIGFAYPTGQRIVYSDLGFILLGEAIARLSGLSFQAYLQKAVLKPMNLQNTTANPLRKGIDVNTIAPTEFCRWRQRRCVGQVHDENAACLGGIAGHAGLFSTAWDVAALGGMYLGFGETSILSPDTIREMTRTQVSINGARRGLGWLLPNRNGRTPVGNKVPSDSYGHTGFTGTSLWIFPGHELVVVLLTNRVYYGRDDTGIANFRPRLHEAVIAALEM